MPRFPLRPVHGKRATSPPARWHGLVCQYACPIVIFVLVLVTTACSSATVKFVLQNDGALLSASSPQITPTYDGSGQVVEPSIYFFPSGWNGFSYWLIVNPYPNSDASKENPSILVSDNGSFWEVPPGLTNPIDLPTTGHLDDSELFYDKASNQLWVYYLWEDLRGFSHILRKVSSDGVNWSPAQDLFKVPDYNVVSPTVDKIGNTYLMWTVNAGTVGCNAKSTTTEYQTSTDGATSSAPHLVSISQAGYVIWHIEVRYVPSKKEYWMLSSAYPEGGQCGQNVLFFSNSSDGVNWTSYPKPTLGVHSGWDSGEIYRSTFLFDSSQDMIKVWYSARGGSEWHMGFTAGIYTDFLLSLQK